MTAAPLEFAASRPTPGKVLALDLADAIAALGRKYEPHRIANWTPNPGPQADFFESSADELLFGGAAGGGKSAAEVALPLRWCNHPRFRALILRRETTQLDDLIDKADALYPREFPRVAWNGSELAYTFPSGAVVKFGHCKDRDDHSKYHGHEYHLIEYDELTHFLEVQYREINKRNRSDVPELPKLVRATTNPGSEGHEWVFARWGAWLNPDFTLESWEGEVDIPVERDGTWTVERKRIRCTGLPARLDGAGKRLPPARPGQLLYVVHVRDGERLSSVPIVDSEGRPVQALTRTFIPARLTDNPKLLEGDPLYLQKLYDNDPVRVAQLADGNWLIKAGKGLYFRREWVTFVDAKDVPANARRCRGWDRAATEPNEKNRDPDWTRGVKLALADIPIESTPAQAPQLPPGARMMGMREAWVPPKAKTDRRYYIEDLVSLRAGPGPVRNLIRATAEADGKAVRIRLPQDPAQAGKAQAANDVASLSGFAVTVKPVSGDKPTRFGPVSAQAHPQSTGGLKGRFCVVRAPWNDELIRELEALWEGAHDDIADALADAFDELEHGVKEVWRGMGQERIGLF